MKPNENALTLTVCRLENTHFRKHLSNGTPVPKLLNIFGWWLAVPMERWLLLMLQTCPNHLSKSPCELRFSRLLLPESHEQCVLIRTETPDSQVRFGQKGSISKIVLDQHTRSRQETAAASSSKQQASSSKQQQAAASSSQQQASSKQAATSVCPIEKNILLRVIPTMTFIHFVTGKSSGILSDISSGICSGISSGIPSGILSGISSGTLSGKSSGIPSGILSSISSGILSGKSAGILSGKHSGTLSGISSGILADILSGILSGIPSGLLSGISSNILSGISSGTLCGISFGVDTRGWGPAGNTGRGWSWLRSGREHWAGIPAVEVRQGTLAVMVVVEVRQGTLRWWSWLRSGREHWEGWSWLRSDRDHCGRGSRLSRRRRGGGEEMRGEEEQATDIKSNNPHLAGGEWSNISFKNQRHTKI